MQSTDFKFTQSSQSTHQFNRCGRNCKQCMNRTEIEDETRAKKPPPQTWTDTSTTFIPSTPSWWEKKARSFNQDNEGWLHVSSEADDADIDTVFCDTSIAQLSAMWGFFHMVNFSQCRDIWKLRVKVWLSGGQWQLKALTRIQSEPSDPSKSIAQKVWFIPTAHSATPLLGRLESGPIQGPP